MKNVRFEISHGELADDVGDGVGAAGFGTLYRRVTVVLTKGGADVEGLVLEYRVDRDWGVAITIEGVNDGSFAADI